MTDDDRTVDADPSMLDEIKRLAAQAEADAASAAPPAGRHGGDLTADADASTLDQIRRLAAAASDTPVTNLARSEPVQRSEDRPAVLKPPRPLEELSFDSVDELGPHQAPRHSDAEAPWVPPERSMRPTDTQSVPRDTARPWRLATAALAVVVVGLLVWALFFNGADGGDEPTDPNGSLVPHGSVNPETTGNEGGTVADDGAGGQGG